MRRLGILSLLLFASIADLAQPSTAETSNASGRATRSLLNLDFAPDEDPEGNFARGKEEISAAAAAMRQALQENGASVRLGGGRGIVMPANGRRQLANAFATLRVLRRELSCRLPVELVYHGDAGMPSDLRLLFESEEMRDVRLVDASQLPQPAHQRQVSSPDERQSRVYALYATDYDQVLLLDPSNLPLEDPTALFDAPEFMEHGDLFWPDFWEPAGQRTVKREAYGVLGLAAPWEVPDAGEQRGTQGGQLMLDRARHADVLEWAWLLAAHGHVMYRYAAHDADLYRAAFALAGKGDSFRQLPLVPRVALGAYDRHQQGSEAVGPFVKVASLRRPTIVEDSGGALYLVLGQVQHGPSGEAAFMHRVTDGAQFDPVVGHALEVGLISEPLSMAQADLLHAGSTVAGTDAPHLWLDPSQVEVQHRGSTRCRVHLAKVHWCKGVKGDRGWPVRAAHIEEFPAALQRALAGSYAAVTEFQERTGGQLLPVTKAGDVIY